MNKIIDWKCPPPRKGLKGFIDRLFGPGATTAEYILQLGFAIAMAVIMLLYVLLAKLPWNIIQIIVPVYLAFDICGGIATNATSSAKRWWHRKERRTWKKDAQFLAAHFYMPLLITLAFFPRDWSFFIISYGYLLFAGFIIAATTLYLRRAVSLMFYAGALILSLYAIPLQQGLIWFLPLFYLKLLVSYLNVEEPYRPNK